MKGTKFKANLICEQQHKQHLFQNNWVFDRGTPFTADLEEEKSEKSESVGKRQHGQPNTSKASPMLG